VTAKETALAIERVMERIVQPKSHPDDGNLLCKRMIARADCGTFRHISLKILRFSTTPRSPDLAVASMAQKMP